MRILLTGKNGQLGRCFQDVVKDTGLELFAFDSAKLDITDAQNIDQVVKQIRPDIIVNAAAYTAVDKAEFDQDKAFLVNEFGPKLLAQQSAKLNIPLIHISTDYVFDGNAVDPYKTDDATNPKSIYGSSKLAGEQAVLSETIRYIILRTSWVFSEYGNNFVKTMMRLANERDELSVVADQYGCPTYAGDLAKGIFQLCEQYQADSTLSWGTYHYSGDMQTSWHGFARAIFSKAFSIGLINKQPLLKAISSDLYPTPTKRPEFSVLDCRQLSILNLVPCNWLKSLELVLNKI